MANKIKDTVEYFPFFVKHGRTLFVLQNKYGLAGIGFFTQIMRWLAQSPGHYYPYNDDFDKDRLNQYCGLTETDVRVMIGDMVKTGKLDSQLWEQRGVIYSADFVDELSELYRRRKKELPTRDKVIRDTASLCRQYDGNMSETPGQTIETIESIETTTEASGSPVSAQPVDNSEPEKLVVAADVKNQLKELPFEMTLSKAQSAQVVKELNSRSLGPSFFSYLSEHIRGQPNIRNPGGLMWKMLSSLDQYEELIKKYRSWSPPKPKVPKPKICPRCGGEFYRMTASAAECDHCGIFDWDGDVGWIQDGEIF
ncbi:MAG: DUF4373 domain-containing protein [Spirochaetota bacterium]|nr:DUF4373 domain-containing protein [Spirochaetota bacterium]